MTTAIEMPTGAETGLTPEQRRIIEWAEGPAVVIAGAGTGKTRVIVERVRHLLETQDGRATPILDLNYEVKAANELQERLDRIHSWSLSTAQTVARGILRETNRAKDELVKPFEVALPSGPAPVRQPEAQARTRATAT